LRRRKRGGSQGVVKNALPRAATVALLLAVAHCTTTVPALRAADVPRPGATPRLPVSSGRPVELRGEIVELSCYLRDGRRGESHKACALTCLKNGGELSLVEDETGDLYPLAGSRPATDPSAKVRDHVAEHVAVSGRLYERAGSRVLVPESVKKLD